MRSQTKHIKCLFVLICSVLLLHQCCLQGVTAVGRRGKAVNWTRRGEKKVVFSLKFCASCCLLFFFFFCIFPNCHDLSLLHSFFYQNVLFSVLCHCMWMTWMVVMDGWVNTSNLGASVRKEISGEGGGRGMKLEEGGRQLKGRWQRERRGEMRSWSERNGRSKARKGQRNMELQYCLMWSSSPCRNVSPVVPPPLHIHTYTHHHRDHIICPKPELYN